MYIPCALPIKHGGSKRKYFLLSKSSSQEAARCPDSITCYSLILEEKSSLSFVGNSQSILQYSALFTLGFALVIYSCWHILELACFYCCEETALLHGPGLSMSQCLCFGVLIPFSLHARQHSLELCLDFLQEFSYPYFGGGFSNVSKLEIIVAMFFFKRKRNRCSIRLYLCKRKSLHSCFYNYQLILHIKYELAEQI